MSETTSNGRCQPTEAEAERTARARIDRLNRLRADYREKHGKDPQTGTLLRKLEQEEREEGKARESPAATAAPAPAPASAANLSPRLREVLEAVRACADPSGVYKAADVLARLGRGDGPAARASLSQAMSQVRDLDPRARHYRGARGRLPVPRSPSCPKPGPSSGVARRVPDPGRASIGRAMAALSRQFESMDESGRQIALDFLVARYSQ